MLFRSGPRQPHVVVTVTMSGVGQTGACSWEVCGAPSSLALPAHSWSAGVPSVRSPESPAYPWVTSMAQQSHQHHKNMPGRKWDEKIS